MIADQLKKSILQAAIEGKLTKQLAEDGDSKDLIRKIYLQKEHLCNEGKIKREKPLPEIVKDEIPFEIPGNWTWMRLGDLCSLITDGTHKTPKYVEKGVPFLSVQNISSGEFDFTKIKYISPTEHAVLVKRCKPEIGDILLCRIGTLGKPIINTLDFEFSIFVSLALIKIIDSSLKDYLVTYLTSPAMDKWIDKNKVGGGTHTNKINLRDLVLVPIPLPPVLEQNRILERLKEILPEIENLKNEENKLQVLQRSFPKKMKDSILQAAIQGKLSEQMESDGDARELLKEINKEKERLVQERKIKKDKPLPEITEDEIPFDIPENWCWFRLGDVGIWSAGSTPNRSNNKYYSNGKIPWIKTGDLNDYVIENAPEFITDLALKETSVKLQPKGTVLIAMYGATIGKLGVLGIEATTNQACCGCITYSGIYNWYLFYYLMAHKQDFIKQGAGGAQPNISREKIVVTLIPLPPLSEQYRIVERLNTLLPLCDSLE